VLAGLVKRISKQIQVSNVEGEATLSKVLAELGA